MTPVSVHISTGLCLTGIVLHLCCASTLGVASQTSHPDTVVELKGTILGRDGDTVPNIEVVLLFGEGPHLAGGRNLAYRAVTDHKGRFRFGVPPGPYRLKLEGDGSGFPDASPDTTLRLGARVTTFDYRYGWFVRVKGRVIGPGKHSIKSGAVHASGVGAWVTCAIKKGRYELNLTPGEYSLSTSDVPSGFPILRYLAPISISRDTTIDIVGDGKPITGSVMFGDRKASSGTEVRAIATHADTLLAAVALVGEDGRYKMYLPPGSYSFSAFPRLGDIGPQTFGSRTITGAQKIDLASAVQWDRARDSLRIEISLDERAYVLGQPILALIKVRNVGSVPFRDLVPIEPWVGRLDIRLDGARLERREITDVVFNQEGIQLPPGAALCTVANLLDRFGFSDTIPTSDGGKVRGHVLGAGHYILQTSLVARTGFVSSLPQVWFKGEPLAFDVVQVPLDFPPGPVRQLKGAKSDSSSMSVAEKRVSLEQTADSKAFYLLWGRSRLSESDFSTGDIIRLLKNHHRSPVLIAAVLDDRCTLSSLPDRERLEWVRARRVDVVDPDAESVIDSWLLRLEQNRYVPRY